MDTDKPRDPAVAPGVDRPGPEAGHEASDVSIRPIVWFGMGLAIATALISLAMWGLFRFFEAGQEKRGAPVPPMVAANLSRTPSGPRLESDPLAPRRAVQAREDVALTTYGWVDQKAGVVRIPIERAMELLVERGLPPPRPPSGPVPLPYPAAAAPGNGKRDAGNERTPTP
jgi:hypothetical protein